MKNTNLKIFIDKYSYKKGEDYNLSFLPMLIRRKLSPLSKIAFSSLYECYENNDVNLVFASKYSEFEKLLQLSKQYKEENEISPIAFSTSVHNATVGAFSLLNKINSSYISIGADDYSFHAGLLDAILNSKVDLKGILMSSILILLFISLVLTLQQKPLEVIGFKK